MEDPTTDARKTALAWLEAGRRIAIATVVDTWGSAPVRPGGQLAVAAIDEFQGSVSGGCVEADVITVGLEVIQSGKPQLLTFGVTDEMAWRSGLACGGSMRVHVVAFDPKIDIAFLRRIETEIVSRRPLVVATRLADGMREIFDDRSGSVIAERIASGKSGVDASGETFLQAITPPWRILIVGATHIGQHLAKMASDCGYDVKIIDPRSAFANPNRFDASQLITRWPEEVLKSAPTDPFTALVTLTHVDHIDDDALKAALASPCGYIGSLGSRKTHAKRVERLKADGFSDRDIGRIHAPIGLPIGAESAAEIAASILGQIIQTFRKPQAA